MSNLSILKKSLIATSGIAIGFLFIKLPYLANAAGFINFNHTHTVDGIGDLKVVDGFFNFNTVNSRAHNSIVDNERSITVEVGSMDSTFLPVSGGLGYLFEATTSGKISFDWMFDAANSKHLFGFVIFDDVDEFNNSLESLTLLEDDFNSSSNFDYLFDQTEYQLLANGALSRGTISLEIEQGEVFGFGLSLGSNYFDLHDCIEMPNFTLSDIAFTPTPTEVPTPAAILPVLTGMFAAARRRKINNEA